MYLFTQVVGINYRCTLKYMSKNIMRYIYHFLKIPTYSYVHEWFLFECTTEHTYGALKCFEEFHLTCKNAKSGFPRRGNVCTLVPLQFALEMASGKGQTGDFQ